MNLPYIKRSLETVLMKAVLRFPDVPASGPYRSGKTILVQQLFGGGYGEPRRVQAGRLGAATSCG